MAWFKNLIIQMDFFVKPYPLKANQQKHNKTILGGLTTILFIFFGCVYFSAILLNSQAEEAQIYAGTQKENRENSLKLDEKSISFILDIQQYKQSKGLANTIVQNMSMQYLEIEVNIVNQIRDIEDINFTRQKVPYILEKCKKDYIKKFNFFPTIFNKALEDELICPKNEFEIYGSFFDERFTYIDISIQKCQNKTEKSIVCAAPSEIDEFIDSGINVDLFLLVSRIKKSLNETEPSQQFAQEVFWRLSSQIVSNEDVFISPITLESCKFHQELNNFQKIKQRWIFFLLKKRIAKNKFLKELLQAVVDQQLASFYIRVDSDEKYYFVNETNLTSQILAAISEVSGLMIAIFSILTFLYQFYNHHKLFETLMNQTFYFDIHVLNKIIYLFIIFQPKEESKPKQDEEDQTGKKDLDRVIFNSSNFIQILNSKIEYSFFSYFKYNILWIMKKLKCKRKTLNKFVLIVILFNFQLGNNLELIIAQQVKEKIQNDLTYVNILKKLYQIDCLKLLLLDQDQLVIFNSFCKPLINEELIKTIVNSKQQFTEEMNSIREKAITTTVINQDKNSRNYENINYFMNSQIPQSNKLVKLSPFFASQYVERKSEKVIEKFSKIQQNSNKNTRYNEKIMNFVQKNDQLYRIVAKYQESLKKKNKKSNFYEDQPKKIKEVKEEDENEDEEQKNENDFNMNFGIGLRGVSLRQSDSMKNENQLETPLSPQPEQIKNLNINQSKFQRDVLNQNQQQKQK